MSIINIFRQYLPLCWFKQHPFELTRSINFLRLNLLFYFIVEYVLQANMTDDPFESFLEVSIETTLTLMFIGLLLFLNRALYAFVQVTTAIILCANIISLFIFPVLVWLTITEDILSYYFLGLLFLWDFLIVAYILRKALSINIPASLALSLFYFIATYLGAFALGQLI
ncbi:MAG: hypothetical protein PHG00_04845 [Methylococcales bacterium]|nr:hypothetical protein [Methylococcales bacterium]